jgi:cytosine/adenosine deaminase-related metal-dependent hydrolase
LADLGVLGNDFIGGHVVVIGGHSRSGYNDPWNKDIQLLADTGSTVVHCPRPFYRYGIAMESYFKYLRMGVNVAIGTDTFPQDLLKEMRLVSIISKIVEGAPDVATSTEVFNSATLSAAKALKRPDLGRIAKEAKADLALIRLDTFNMCPMTDPLRTLVQVADRSDVDTVIANGKTVVEGGKVIGFDEEKILAELQKSMERVCSKVPEYDRLHRTAAEIVPPSLKKLE